MANNFFTARPLPSTAAMARAVTPSMLTASSSSRSSLMCASADSRTRSCSSGVASYIFM